MDKRAIIDIGSNSLRLVIYNICKNSKFRIIYETKQTIRLGSYLTDENYLLEEGVNIAISVLDNFKKICENYSVIDIYTVATEAIRKSINKEAAILTIDGVGEWATTTYGIGENNKITLMKQMNFPDSIGLLYSAFTYYLGFKVNILSGKEEAKYGYLSVKNSMIYKDAVLLDLGGSSMEISLMEDGELIDSISFPLGCIPLTAKFNNLETKQKAQELNLFINDKLNNISWIKKNNKFNVIGIGGIAKHIGLVSKENEDYPKELLHGYSINKKEISEIYYKFLNLSIDERFNVRGLSKKRAEIFAAPLGAILTILEYLNSEVFIINALGLREGIIYEMLENSLSLK